MGNTHSRRMRQRPRGSRYTGWVIAYPTRTNQGCRCWGDSSGGPLNPNWNLYAITAKTPPPAPPAAPPAPASTTDIQTASWRPIKADCAAGNGGSDGSCEMGAVSSANGGGTAYSECTEVTSIVAAKTGQWGYLGLRDGKISQNGSPGDRRNYRLQSQQPDEPPPLHRRWGGRVLPELEVRDLAVAAAAVGQPVAAAADPSPPRLLCQPQLSRRNVAKIRRAASRPHVDPRPSALTPPTHHAQAMQVFSASRGTTAARSATASARPANATTLSPAAVVV